MRLTSTLLAFFALGIPYPLCSLLRCRWDNLDDAIATWGVSVNAKRVPTLPPSPFQLRVFLGRHRALTEEECFDPMTDAVIRASKGRGWRLMWDANGLSDRFS